jgi:hypothetical protein
MINKQQYEAQLQQIFRMLLENKTQEEIAHELNISTRTVARYSSRIQKRYGAAQRQKTDDTLLIEVQLFKNRMLTLYKGLEGVVTSKDTEIWGIEKAKAAEVAANIAIDLIKADSELIHAVKQGLVNISTTSESVVANKNNTTNLNNLRNSNNGNDDDYDYDGLDKSRHHNQQQHQEQEDDKP